MPDRSVKDLDLAALARRRSHASPEAWEDEVIYFLMLDRFSDGKEKEYRDNDGEWVAAGKTPPFRPEDAGSAWKTDQDRASWFEAGGKWVGGTLKGLASKLGYLQRLGVTAVWVSPVFRQVKSADSYHGYGIQNFLEVDRHFGTRKDLKDMVRAAHDLGIRVILDIILQHSGNVFAYDADRYPTPGGGMDARWDGRPYAVKGFRDRNGEPALPFGPVNLETHPDAWPDGALWPAELQSPDTFTRKGRISNWDWDPEFVEGDFCDLKDIHLGSGDPDHYRPSPALRTLCEAYKFWMAYADVDGYRVDTVKHMDLGATRYFASVMHEFAQRIGKENFYLIGEITGGRERAFRTVDLTGLDAALGIDDIPDKLEYLVKGWRDPAEYFGLFRNSMQVQKDSHVWFRNKVVTLFDDHDQVRKGQNKARFCADGPEAARLVLAALALNATTLGIPCIYYGTEQGFDGAGDNDRYLREAMFGGKFGPFGSAGRHCFDEEHSVYRELATILEIRREHIALRRGRQYLREISGNGVDFGLPRVLGGRMRSVVPWSRIFDDQEMLCAINTDPDQPRAAWTVVDSSLNPAGKQFKCIYSTDPAQIGARLEVRGFSSGASALLLAVPAAGFVIYG